MLKFIKAVSSSNDCGDGQQTSTNNQSCNVNMISLGNRLRTKKWRLWMACRENVIKNMIVVLIKGRPYCRENLINGYSRRGDKLKRRLNLIFCLEDQRLRL